MAEIELDKKSYVIIRKEDYEQLQLAAAKKTSPIKKLSLTKGRQHAYQLIDQWTKGK